MKTIHILALIFIACLAFNFGFNAGEKYATPKTHKRLDMPEEIDLAKPGDKLIVIDTLDNRINIGYDNEPNN